MYVIQDDSLFTWTCSRIFNVNLDEKEHPWFPPLVCLPTARTSVHFYLTRMYNTDDGASASRSFVKWLEHWLMNHHFVTPT